MLEILDMREVGLGQIKARQQQTQPNVDEAVAAILEDVRKNGDAAVLAYTQKFDGARLQDMRVSEAEIEQACSQVGQEYLEMLRAAADNIREFHQRQLRQGFVQAKRPGVVMGQRVIPLARVGVYVPGGTAAYPSTVLMDVIPAKIAGVGEIVMATPPGADGSVSAAILAAASVAGVSDIYKMGGAQAVAALAYGTSSISAVDKIVGPGNAYVATAKRMVYGLVDIDMIAGPSDILVVADKSANAEFVAADMLGQAEHDALATAILVTTDMQLAEDVRQQIESQLENLPRREIAQKSLESSGCILYAQDMQQAMEAANALAPEHLELCVEEPFAWLPAVQNAGSIFLGHYTPEALGDYWAGPNHTLPTGGTARFSSPLSVDDFIKKSSYLYYTREALAEDARMVEMFAASEGLDAHANSVALRMKQE